MTWSRKINDFATTTADGLIAATRFYAPGTEVTITYTRGDGQPRRPRSPSVSLVVTQGSVPGPACPGLGARQSKLRRISRVLG